MNVRGKTIAVLGGDRRMTEAARFFRRTGAMVRMAGVLAGERPSEVQLCDRVDEALYGADVAVLPVQGTTEEGKIFTQPGCPTLTLHLADLRGMKPDGVIFVGITNQYLRVLCAEANLAVLAYREVDEFAIWNSIPSAEGAIQMAMETSSFTVFGSRSLVLGFGRTGKALALFLRGLCSDVTVAVRDPLDFARVWASGYRYISMKQLMEAVQEVDLIFNTVPARVLTRELLRAAQRHVVVIDLASAPGGTDFEAATALGISAHLAPGLPGIVAPVTAGKIIADMILRHLMEHRGEEGIGWVKERLRDTALG